MASPAPQQGLAGLMLSAAEPPSTPMQQPPGLAQAATENVAKDAKKEGAPEWAMPLIVMGLTMAGSRKPGLLAAAAEGGIAGIQAMYAQKQSQRQEERDQLAQDREERITRLEEQKLGLSERGMLADEDFRRRQEGFEREKFGAAQTESAADRKLKEQYYARLGQGSPREPDRLEKFGQVYNGFVQAGLPPDKAMAAAKDVFQAAYAPASGGGTGEPSSFEIDKLIASSDFQAMAPEQQQEILRRYGRLPPDPNEAFFQGGAPGGGMTPMQGF